MSTMNRPMVPGLVARIEACGRELAKAGVQYPWHLVGEESQSANLFGRLLLEIWGRDDQSIDDAFRLLKAAKDF